MASFHAQSFWSFLLVVLLLTGQGVHFACHALHFIEEQGGVRCQEMASPHSCTGHERLRRLAVTPPHAAAELSCPLCQGQSYELAVGAEVPGWCLALLEKTVVYEAPVLDGACFIAAARGPPSAVSC